MLSINYSDSSNFFTYYEWFVGRRLVVMSAIGLSHNSYKRRKEKKPFVPGTTKNAGKEHSDKMHIINQDH